MANSIRPSAIFEVGSDATEAVIVELSDGTRRYRKQIAKFGEYVDPHGRVSKMVHDLPWAQNILKNFRNRVIKNVPVVEGHPRTAVELLAATRGELASLSIEGDKIYGDFEIRDPEYAKKIDQQLVFDTSISYDENFVDKATGTAMGPTLKHLGLVNAPYIQGLGEFQALSDGDQNVIMLSESKELEMPKVKNDHEYPVKVTIGGKEVELQPGAEAEVTDGEAAAVTKAVSEATKPETAEEKTAREAKEAADKKAADDKAETDRKAAADKAKADGDINAQLTAAQQENAKLKQELSERSANEAYTVALSEGKIIPAQEQAFKTVYTGAAASGATIELSDGKTQSLSDAFAELVKTMPKRVDLSEKGTSGADGGDGKTPWQKQTAEQQEASRKMGITEEEFNKINGPAKPDEGKE